MSEVTIPLSLLIGWLVAMLCHAVAEDWRNGRRPPNPPTEEPR